MIHQPKGGATGQATDISIAAREVLKWRDALVEVLARHTGKTEEQVRKDSDREYYLSAAEAKAYGLVDEVIKTKPLK